ncbi:MAG TPA: hypothetical protein VGQ62_15485 [Chloroflexota bacterium]|jgi:hypothetical protein|nr:hypothetical protein [Chloroflexota bacterium]
MLAVLFALAATVLQQSDPTLCSLFSATDVSAILGEPVVANNRFGCEFDSLPDAHPFKVIRFIPDYPAADDFRTDAQRVATDNDGLTTFTALDGVGDEAYTWHDRLGYTRVDVRSGAQSVEIFVDLGTFPARDLPERINVGRQLAAIAVDHFTANQ